MNANTFLLLPSDKYVPTLLPPQSSSLTLSHPSHCTICICSLSFPFSLITQSFLVRAVREHPYDQRHKDKRTKSSLPTPSCQCLTGDADLWRRRHVNLLRFARVPDLRRKGAGFLQTPGLSWWRRKVNLSIQTFRSSTMAFPMPPAFVDHGACSIASRRLAIPCWPNRPVQPSMQLKLTGCQGIP